MTLFFYDVKFGERNARQNIIHITWEGPYSFEEAQRQRNEVTDYGVYQIYGTHPVYGANVLLYIGKEDRQTFGVRLSQEGWKNNLDANTIQVYLGNLGGYEGTPSNDDWSWQIFAAESLLIYAHVPAWNSSGLNKEFDAVYHDVHVLNWGMRRDLYPEVSGKFYSTKYYVENREYKTFEYQK